jgi:hypothetical protein
MTKRATRTVVALLLCTGAVFAQVTSDPFPQPIAATEGIIGVKFVEFATIPDSGGQAPRPMLLDDEPGKVSRPQRRWRRRAVAELRARISELRVPPAVQPTGRPASAAAHTIASAPSAACHVSWLFEERESSSLQLAESRRRRTELCRKGNRPRSRRRSVRGCPWLLAHRAEFDRPCRGSATLRSQHS